MSKVENKPKKIKPAVLDENGIPVCGDAAYIYVTEQLAKKSKSIGFLVAEAQDTRQRFNMADPADPRELKLYKDGKGVVIKVIAPGMENKLFRSPKYIASVQQVIQLAELLFAGTPVEGLKSIVPLLKALPTKG